MDNLRKLGIALFCPHQQPAGLGRTEKKSYTRQNTIIQLFFFKCNIFCEPLTYPSEKIHFNLQFVSLSQDCRVNANHLEARRSRRERVLLPRARSVLPMARRVSFRGGKLTVLIEAQRRKFSFFFLISTTVGKNIHRQTDRQTDRKTDSETDRQKDRQTERQAPSY